MNASAENLYRLNIVITIYKILRMGISLFIFWLIILIIMSINLKLVIFSKFALFLSRKKSCSSLCELDNDKITNNCKITYLTITKNSIPDSMKLSKILGISALHNNRLNGQGYVKPVIIRTTWLYWCDTFSMFVTPVHSVAQS